ncbi:MAG: exodeoxyribonuclease VII large subunit [Akkermansiaceae bacterium]|nr:exodeoxyribonuclease VII large subunit [Akkermansiaceae bacterium]
MDLFSSRPAAEPKALSVTQLVRRMKNLLEIQLGEQWVEGEVSNLRKQGSGHWYFSLKDEGAQISCAMFGAARKAGAAALVDGAKVRVFAEPSVYEARGQLQIIVQKVEQAGLGDLQARFEALKRKLEAEGLFAPERKRPLPGFPRVVGIVTSGTGAAIEDILHVLGRRAPWVVPVLLPVRVQGRGAEMEIAAAMEKMGSPEKYGIPRSDVIIVGRGGGSIEDLWNFNEEVVARAIAACPIPVISAVGHEIDFTIADFVADRRAPTPSAAAEMAVPDGEELRRQLAMTGRRLSRRVEERISRLDLVLANVARGVLSRGGERLLREPALRVDAVAGRLSQALAAGWREKTEALAGLRQRLGLMKPERQLAQREEILGQWARRLKRAAGRDLDERGERLRRLAVLLKALGPASAFERGFSITTTSEGKVIRSVREAKPGDDLVTRVADGLIRSRVEGGDSGAD